MIYDVIVVGAGMSGVSARKVLTERGLKVLTLEKSRGVGGRASTKRDEDLVFDLGAQSFNFDDRSFQKIQATRIKGINSFVKSLLDESSKEASPVFFQEKVLKVFRDSALSCFCVQTESGGLHRAKNLVLSSPMPQSLLLVETIQEYFQKSTLDQLRSVTYRACIALAIILNEDQSDPALPLQCINNPLPELEGVYSQGLKYPSSAQAWVAHASEEWSNQNWGLNETEATQGMVDLVRSVFKHRGYALNVRKTIFHKWRYSRPKTTLPEKYLLVGDREIGNVLFVGDCFQDNSLEGAFLSGQSGAAALASRI